jgi:hypothetical protein
MTEEIRMVFIVLAICGYAVFVLFALRSLRHAARIALQWDNAAGDHWKWGKRLIVVGVVGVFVSGFLRGQGFWQPVVFFGSLVALIYGESRIGSGFKVVADAQENWHRRNFMDEE